MATLKQNQQIFKNNNTSDHLLEFVFHDFVHTRNSHTPHGHQPELNNLGALAPPQIKTTIYIRTYPLRHSIDSLI